MNKPSENERYSAPIESPLSEKFDASHDDSRSSTNYDSALENLTVYTSFNESANNNSLYASSNKHNNTSTDFDVTLNATLTEFNPTTTLKNKLDVGIITNASTSPKKHLAQSDVIFKNVDSKPELSSEATILNRADSDVSIIEISHNSSQESEHLENSALLIDTSVEEDYPGGQHIKPPQVVDKDSDGRGYCRIPSTENAKRGSKAEAIMHSSKQMLNLSNTTYGVDTSTCKVEQNGNATANSESAKKRKITVYDTLEEFEKNLPSTVTVLDTPFGSKVYLVGTAHFSEESQDDVSYVIRNVRPDVVMVELCKSRIHILKLDEKTLLEEAKSFNFSKIRNIIQSNGYINGIFFILMLQMSAQIAKDLGMAPGGEFRRAFEEIHKLPGCILHLGDRPIRVTLQRALRALSLWQTLKLVWKLTSKDTISLEEVEQCKQKDLLEKLMEEMAGEFPTFSDVFVKERDMFLCHSLQLAALPQARANGTSANRPVRVVGVVGIGHASGIARNWGRVDPQMIPAIMEIPPPRTSTRVCQYTFKYGFIALSLWGVFKILRPRLSRFF